jgi:hypothetical protein
LLSESSSAGIPNSDLLRTIKSAIVLHEYEKLPNASVGKEVRHNQTTIKLLVEAKS